MHLGRRIGGPMLYFGVGQQQHTVADFTLPCQTHIFGTYNGHITQTFQ